MDLNRAHLNDFQQTLFIVDVEIFIPLPFVPEFEGMDVLAETLPRTALKETLLSVDAGRAAQQTERVTRDARQHEGCDGSVIFSKLSFRDVSYLRNDSVRMANSDAGTHDRAWIRGLGTDGCRNGGLH